ncbi:MAG: invasion associated locus B family protein [Hyphomicrobiales bacterium]
MNTVISKKYLVPMLGAAALFATPAHAQEPTEIGTFGDWKAYSYSSDGGKVCYIISQPKESSPKDVKRDPVHFIVTHRTKGKSRNEVNTIIGYPFKKGSYATLQIDGNAYELFTNGDGAWLDSKDKDSRVVAGMKRGRKMSVKGVSWRGTKTSDAYSLSGVTAAMKAIDDACK